MSKDTKQKTTEVKPSLTTADAKAPEADVNRLLGDIVNAIGALGQKIDTMEARVSEVEKKETGPALAIGGQAKKEEPVMLTEDGFLTMVPQNIKKAVGEILGDDFEVTCQASTDHPSFLLELIVPKRFGTWLKEEVVTTDKVTKEKHSKTIEHPDRRVKVISNAEGVHGVRMYCELVKQNLVRHTGKQLK